MAKKFMYVCLGILALAVAFHLGARYGSASIVDPSKTGIIACHSTGAAGDVFVLLDNGESWVVSSYPGVGWSTHGIPVPVSDVKFFNAYSLVTNSDEVWIYDAIHYEEPWQNFGAPPGGAYTEPSTWGKIKAEWGE